MKDYLVPFSAALLIAAAAFLALDIAVMSIQGLSLVYTP